MNESGRHSAAVMVVEMDILGTPVSGPSETGTNLQELFRHICARSLEENGGAVLNKSGYAVCGEFPDVPEALRAAAAIQRQLAERGRSFPKEAVKAGIGIHFGEIESGEQDAAGDGPGTARRLAVACKPGSILLSGEGYRQISGETGFAIHPADGLGQPGSPRFVETYEVRPGGRQSRRYENEDEPIRPEEIRDYILDEIRRAGKRFDADDIRRKLPANNREIDKALDWLVDRGFLSESAGRHGKSRYSAAASSYNDADSLMDPRYPRYLKKVTREAEKAMPGFRAHFTTFLAVNAGLVVLNILTGGGFPWALFPIFGWGIGLFTHYVASKVSLWKKRHLDTLPKPTEKEYGLIRKIHSAVSGFAGHASSNAAVAVFLLMTDIITGPGMLWSLIPITAMAIPVFIHWTSFKSRMKKLTSQLKESIRKNPSGRYDGSSPVSGDPSVQEAERLRGVILRQVESLGDKTRLLGDDIPDLLNTYVTHIRTVAAKVSEIDGVIAEIPTASLKEDRRKLEERLESSDQERLKAEYKKSIEEIDAQLKGYQELRSQQEMVRLRLRSSLNTMKQLQLDLAALAGAATLDSGEISSIEREIQAMTEKLEDLQAGYDELEKDL